MRVSNGVTLAISLGSDNTVSRWSRSSCSRRRSYGRFVTRRRSLHRACSAALVVSVLARDENPLGMSSSLLTLGLAIKVDATLVSASIVQAVVDGLIDAANHTELRAATHMAKVTPERVRQHFANSYLISSIYPYNNVNVVFARALVRAQGSGAPKCSPTIAPAPSKQLAEHDRCALQPQGLRSTR